MTRNISFAPGEFYHIYNRGTDKRKIFLRAQDYLRFLSLLYIANSTLTVDLKQQGSTLSEILATNKGESLVDICAYCLMPNHFHIILRENRDNGISKFMQKLTTAYTMYFNKLNSRTGSLLQGRFKAEHANNDEYLSYLIAYLHLNPIKLFEPKWKELGIKDKKWAETFLKNYKYSSFLDYSEQESRVESKILNKHALPEYHKLPRDFSASINEWLSWKSVDK
jgi:putative transposase